MMDFGPLESVKEYLTTPFSPDCSRIELSQLPAKRDGIKLVRAMGLETANIHLGTKNVAGKIVADLRKRPAGWLYKAAKAMEEATVSDWKQWRA